MVVHPPKSPQSLQPTRQTNQESNPVHLPRPDPKQTSHHRATCHHQRARRRYKRRHQNPDLQPPRPIRAPHEKSHRMVVLPPQRTPTQTPPTNPTPPPKTRPQTRAQTTKTRPETMGQRHRLQPQIPRRIPTHPQRLGRTLTHPDTPGKRHTIRALAPKTHNSGISPTIRALAQKSQQTAIRATQNKRADHRSGSQPYFYACEQDF